MFLFSPKVTMDEAGRVCVSLRVQPLQQSQGHDLLDRFTGGFVIFCKTIYVHVSAVESLQQLIEELHPVEISVAGL